VVATIAQGQDITERVEAEVALRGTRDFLQNLLDYANAPVIVWDPDLRITLFNHAFERLTGRSADEVRGQPIEVLFPADERRQAAMGLIQRAMAGERWETVEIPIAHVEGEVRTVLWNSATLRGLDGETVATIAQGHDITQRKRAEADLQRAVTQLEATNAELAVLMSVASHDLREPLRAVVTGMQLMERRHGAELSPAARELLSRAVGGAGRLGRLMEDILAYARAGSVALSPERVDCAALVERVVDDLQGVMGETGATVTCDPCPVVTADPTMLGRVFQNLVTNALKFRGTEPPVVAITAEQQGGEWVFSVSDNGIGMSRDDVERIFRPFERLHGRHEYEGTGVGLAICRRVVERHGGRIWAESEEGKGSTFYFTLPLARL
jgi:PAS domain S-box-containing protein